MTPKEILRKSYKENNVSGIIGGSSPLEISIIEAMKEYARIKCKEQREISLRMLKEEDPFIYINDPDPEKAAYWHAIHNLMFKAPDPEIE